MNTDNSNKKETDNGLYTLLGLVKLLFYKLDVMEKFKDERYYISKEVDTYNEWKWYKKKKQQPKRGQYLITEDKEKYDILDVVIYTDEFTMINDYGKDYGKKKSIDETNYDMCFWNRLSDGKDCHITFLICCNKSKQ